MQVESNTVIPRFQGRLIYDEAEVKAHNLDDDFIYSLELFREQVDQNLKKDTLVIYTPKKWYDGMSASVTHQFEINVPDKKAIWVDHTPVTSNSFLETAIDFIGLFFAELRPLLFEDAMFRQVLNAARDLEKPHR